MRFRAVNCFVSTKVGRILNIGVGKKYSQSTLIDPAETNTSIDAGVKKLKRQPFALNLFIGKFDDKVLAFPEVLGPEKLQQLNEIVAPVEQFFENEVDSKAIDELGKIPEQTFEALKALGLFGLQIPTEYGGLGLNATEYARMCEVVALDGSIGVTLAAHQAIGLKGILIDGTDEQKKKYLPYLATGEWIAAFCLTESSSGSDAASIKTTAVLSDDKKTWILNGSKLWISNGGLANVFTVFAKTAVQDIKGDTEDKVTAFIVERDFGGVTNGKPEDKMGIRGSNTCEVFFENTPVPASNVLGNVGDGFKVAMNILNSGRFSVGSSSAGILKKLIGLTANHAINRKQFSKQLKDFQLIQEKIAIITCTTYAMESMAYLTAGMLDTYEDPDCAVEAAMVKVFSSEGLWYGVSECLQILGGLGYMKNYPYERILRDSRIAMIFESTNEIMRIFISMMGLQHAGIHLNYDIKQIRNPVLYPVFAAKKLWERFKRNGNNPKMTLGLSYHLHPSLQVSGEQLEDGVLRLQFAVEIILGRHGAKVTEYQMELKRIADIVIDLYAMTAVLSRASRSYCIGLRHSEHEIYLATAFCKDAHQRLKKAVMDIEIGPVLTNDITYSRIANRVFDSKGYFPVHPLTRNF